MLALHLIPPLYWTGFPFGGIPIFENVFGISFSLNLVFNTGAAWGLFQGHPGLLFLLRLFIIGGFGTYFYLRQKIVFQTIAFGLIAVGAIGNSVDYLLHGCVVDFFHFVFWGHSFPIFNIADSCITLGTIGFILQGNGRVTRLNSSK
jgi:signal peptidase II